MTLRLNGDGSGFTEIKAADAAGDNSITLPTSNGGANQLLQNGGTAGALQYTSAGGGLHYDSSGHLLVGTATARTNINNGGTGWTPYGQFEFANNGWEGVSIINNNGSGFGGKLTIGTSYGGAVGSNLIGSDNAQNGRLSFQANDGTSFVENAVISARIEGDPASGVMPGKLIFATNAGGAATTDRVEIGSNGALKLLAGCPGIDFDGAQTETTQANATDTSTTLNHYECGTWTPQSGDHFGAFSNAVGHYVRVGRFVHCTMQFNFASCSSSAPCQILGLPFVPDAHNPSTGIQSTNVVYENEAVFMVWPEENNTPQAFVLTNKPLQGTTNTSGGLIRGSFHFQTAT